MNIRSKKLLSLFLASSMAFSMNAPAFGAEEASAPAEMAAVNLEEADSVLEAAGTEGRENSAVVAGAESKESSAAAAGAESKESSAAAAGTEGKESSAALAVTEAKENSAATVTEATGAAEAVILADSVSTAGDPISWNSVENQDVLEPLFQYPIIGTNSEHIANGKSYPVSANGGTNGTTGLLFGETNSSYDPDTEEYTESYGFSEGVSSNVFKVLTKTGEDQGVRLIVLYRLKYYAAGASRKLTADNIPYVVFDGRKVGTKESAKERDSINVVGSLVKYDATTGKVEVLANSGSMNSTGPKGKPMLEFKVKAKNNLYATVSGNMDENDKFIDIRSENKNLKKADDYPFFTISVKVNDDKAKSLKDYKSLLKKAVDADGTTLINKHEFKFQIARDYFAYQFSDSVSENMQDHVDNYDHGSYGYNHDLVYDIGAFLSLETVKDSEAVKIKNNDGDIKVQNWSSYLWKWDKKKQEYVETNKTWAYKLKKAGTTGTAVTKKGDYTTSVMTDPTGSSDGILVLTPCGNYEGDSATFRTVKYTDAKGVEVKETRKGVYQNNENWFVMDED
ncbi:MAG: hypothetical protein K5989_05575 [Lachnospiraceae bacterium]|nr:hypothetical protein [Lachnospiraceae bacterium]